MSPIKEAIEALEKLIDYSTSQLCPHEDTYRGGVLWEICRTCGAKWADDEGGRPEWTEPKQIIEARAALAALRSMPAEPVANQQQEIDTITELNHAQWLALGKASLLVAACNRLSGEAEEFDFDDGLGRGAPQAYWDEFEDALEHAAEAIDVANKTIHQYHIATPHTAPLNDAEIRDIVTDWFDDGESEIKRGMNLARAIERAVLGRGGEQS